MKRQSARPDPDGVHEDDPADKVRPATEAMTDRARLAAAFAVVASIHTAVGLCVLYSRRQSEDGHEHGPYRYDPAVLVLLAETVKLLTAIAMHALDESSSARASLQSLLRVDTLLYCIPALVYFAQNSVQLHAMAEMSPAAYQILTQLKIVFTALLSRFAGRVISSTRWAAVALLTVGAMVSLVTCSADQAFSVSAFGLILCCVASALSSIGGVTSELLLKRRTPTPSGDEERGPAPGARDDSINMRNIKLYMFGVTIGICTVAHRREYLAERGGLFAGFDSYLPWLICLLSSYLGIAVSFLLRYGSALHSRVAAVVALCATVVLSALLFTIPVTQTLLYSVVIVSIGLFLYQYEPPPAH